MFLFFAIKLEINEKLVILLLFKSAGQFPISCDHSFFPFPFLLLGLHRLTDQRAGKAVTIRQLYGKTLSLKLSGRKKLQFEIRMNSNFNTEFYKILFTSTGARPYHDQMILTTGKITAFNIGADFTGAT